MPIFNRSYLLVLLLLLGSPAMAAGGNIAEAARSGDQETVRALIKSGMDVNLTSGDGTTALAHAAHRNDLPMVEELLKAGANVDLANDYGATALYLASASADEPLIEKLLAAGANPNSGLLSGETPLMAATYRGKIATVKLLLAHDADPNASETHSGQTGLMWAVADKRSELVKVLVESEADVNISSKGGFSPLMFAAQQGDVGSAQILLAAGAAVNEMMPKTGLTPLLVASASGFEEMATTLLEQGAKTDPVDSKGYTALHLAARNINAVGVVKTLLKFGANPNARLNHPKGKLLTSTEINLQGATPLLLAADINNLEAITAMLEAGADPMIPTEQNITALMMAAGAGASFTEERPADAKALALQAVKLFVKLGGDVKTKAQFGWTPMHLAAYHGQDDVIKYLAEQGANLNEMDGFGQTPLSIASAIVTEGIGDAYRQTPLRYRKETAELLLSLGATTLEKSGVKRVSERASK
jgi:ankyrin repeat protein